MGESVTPGDRTECVRRQEKADAGDSPAVSRSLSGSRVSRRGALDPRALVAWFEHVFRFALARSGEARRPSGADRVGKEGQRVHAGSARTMEHRATRSEGHSDTELRRPT